MLGYRRRQDNVYTYQSQEERPRANLASEILLVRVGLAR